MKRMTRWLALLLTISLLVGCGDSGHFIRDNYSLIDVQGQGDSSAKIYSVSGKDVPAVANEIAAAEPPQEMSKESDERMFLIYDHRMIHVQDDPNNDNTTLVEVNSIAYVREHYDSSFLQGYMTAVMLQSVLGGGWLGSRRGTDYRGYTSTRRYDDYGKYQAAPYSGSAGGSAGAPARKPTDAPPATTNRRGSFTQPAKPAPTEGQTGAVRRNDGSTPNYSKAPTGSGSTKPSTTRRTGSFKRR
ncbi:DUF4247 domain-containing protein [Paenibacillus sp. YYML68]|uniref:DUF4247 domain-containing protein n=1 Tax=Paenibacillus sp. YYML68 TaxID=2909250 RepID=UPI002491D348|nr:DUF4247 domain-containing protein [Paenibacillus sp. YYML68]